MINNDFSIKKNQDGEEGLQKTKTGPSKTPKKSFQKVFAKEQEEGQKNPQKQEFSKDDLNIKKGSSFEDVTDKLEKKESSPKTEGLSLFALAANKEIKEEEEVASLVTENEDLFITELPEDIQKGSLSALFQGYGLKELPDLATVNPFPLLQMPLNPPTIENFHEIPKSQALHMKEIVDQIINKLYTLDTSGKTDTLITLKHPPLFAGTNIVITSFKTAKGEFNITFENLNQEAQKLLDRIESQNTLKSALAEKGYTVHIITTTSLSETLPLVEGQKQEPTENKREEGSSLSDKKKRQQKQEENA